jgi:hypothetical protein
LSVGQAADAALGAVGGAERVSRGVEEGQSHHDLQPRAKLRVRLHLRAGYVSCVSAAVHRLSPAPAQVG